MEFLAFSEFCGRLEFLRSRLEMTSEVALVLPGLSDSELPIFVRFLQGRIFPEWSPLKLGIGPNHVYDAVGWVTGRKRDEVIGIVNAEGDLGDAIAKLLVSREQTSFFAEPLDLERVFSDFEVISGIEGGNSQKEKLKVVRRLFVDASPLEGRYLGRLMLGELRIGVGEGTIRDAIAAASAVPPEVVEHAMQAMNDLGEVALLARQGEAALSEVSIEPFRPVKMMLARQGTVADMLEKKGEIAAETKYDGTRFQFHKVGSRCMMYSRKLENVTPAIPDVVRMLSKSTVHDVILDGEVIAVKEGRPLPFQYVLRRFRRKHDIANHIEKIELVPHVFDILYLDGETLIEKPFSERRRILEEVVSGYVAPQEVSGDKDFIESFYLEALDAGHEGIMVKSRDAPYTPGVRGRDWTKIKPAVDTIDLAVVGAEWGEGRRAHLFGSFLLACQRDGELIPISKVATGLSDNHLSMLYDLLKETVIATSGKEVTLEPTLVFEVGYAEIQESQNYPAGYALRFPRFIRYRDDKGVDEVESLDLIKERFSEQQKAEMN